MANSPIAGIYFPGAGLSVDVPGDMKKMTDSLDPLVVAQFASTSLRDATIDTPQLGQVISCLDSGLWQFLSVSDGWVPVGPREIANYSLSVNWSSASGAGIPNITTKTYVLTRRRNIRVTVSGITISGDTVGQSFQLLIRDELQNLVDVRKDITKVAGPGAFYPGPMVSPLLVRSAGTHTITATLAVTSGGGAVTVSNGLTVSITDESAASA